MTGKPPDDKDEEVRRWMKSKGWEVTSSDYHFDRKVHAWRHEVPRQPPTILRISQQVLDQYPASAIVELLDRLRVAQAIRANPQVNWVVVQQGLRVTLEESPPE